VTGAVRSAVLITASEPEPRAFGKQVVIGGLLDHLVRRLGPDQVHVVLIGREDVDRPTTAYRTHVIAKPAAADQVRSLVTRVVGRPHTPLQEAALWSPGVRDRLRSTLAGIGADLEIWDTMRTGQYALALTESAPADPGSDRPNRPRSVLYADDLFSKRYASMLRRIRTDQSRLANPLGEFGKVLPGPARRIVGLPLVYRPLLKLEERLCARSEEAAPGRFDATILVNPEETEELTRRSGSDTVRTLLPLLPEPRSRPERWYRGPEFVFLGGLDFPPNADGLTWFLRECREAVLDAVPDFRLLLVGRGTDRDLPEAEPWGDRVRAAGWVDDLDAVLAGAAGLLSPLRFGSGIKIKVLEALARGLPVVATPAGVLGLPVGSEQGCLVGEGPGGLAAQLAAAADPARNDELSSAARAAWETGYAPAVVSRAYDDVLGLSGEVRGS
jgi:glycosyltransferase involved in cell wall biosynthesis